ncbi:hypothetical protein A0H81_08481 [Grifola frondosa]|uniref:Uncharacterized protein n=1 Tax=Grifola frondosa TaxID=5627 RepID=A0A1C7M355_GRIFR|nr:hypothetical protein A0H81_08481 [Grifola frondosa]
MRPVREAKAKNSRGGSYRGHDGFDSPVWDTSQVRLHSGMSPTSREPTSDGMSGPDPVTTSVKVVIVVALVFFLCIILALFRVSRKRTYPVLPVHRHSTAPSAHAHDLHGHAPTKRWAPDKNSSHFQYHASRAPEENTQSPSFMSPSPILCRRPSIISMSGSTVVESAYSETLPSPVAFPMPAHLGANATSSALS